MEYNIAIIDVDSLVFSAFHPKKILDELGNPMRTPDNKKFLYQEKTLSEIIDSCDSLMNLILTNSNATHYIGFIKGRNTTNNRLLVNPEYKANRGKESPKYWKFCKEYLKLKWRVIEAHESEVDDYVNVTRLGLKNAYIVGIDKDLLSLETTDKFHYNWRTNTWVEVNKEQANNKFWSDMITGQPGDNIKGIPGKGQKFFENLINTITENEPHGVNKENLTLLLKGEILIEYIKYFGEEIGINEFYRNYKCLKILDKIEGFQIPDPIEYRKVDTAEEENKIKNIF